MIFIFCTEATFGFDPIQYTVNEGTTVRLFVSLTSGTLEKEIPLQISTADGTAVATAVTSGIVNTFESE